MCKLEHSLYPSHDIFFFKESIQLKELTQVVFNGNKRVVLINDTNIVHVHMIECMSEDHCIWTLCMYGKYISQCEYT